jgi:hypothetical protein
LTLEGKRLGLVEQDDRREALRESKGLGNEKDQGDENPRPYKKIGSRVWGIGFSKTLIIQKTKTYTPRRFAPLLSRGE